MLLSVLHWVSLGTGNKIHENVLVVSDTRCDQTFKTIDVNLSAISEKNLLVINARGNRTRC